MKLAPLIAIACGGTGGHLFPGLAVAAALEEHGVDTVLLVSQKEVDQHAAQAGPGRAVEVLPAIGLTRGRRLAFGAGFCRAYIRARRLFRRCQPRAVLAMGGFTSAPPILAVPAFRTPTFLHEANSIPGRANRWLAPWVDQAFVYFPSAGPRLRNHAVRVTGMPVRPQFQPMDPAGCRMALGLDPARPVLLITGGSQGAAGLNEIACHSLPRLHAALPDLQYLHLTGSAEADKVRSFYATQPVRSVVRPFISEMEYALGAATVAVSRAGASSLAELAALRLPALLIPYPAAVDNHQFFNALALVESGAARMIAQPLATPELFTQLVVELVQAGEMRAALGAALARWHQPHAARDIAECLLQAVNEGPELEDRAENLSAA